MNDSPLTNFLLQFHYFTPQQLRLIQSRAVARTYQPGDYFSQAGRVAQEIGFIVSGIFRVCYYDCEGTDHTKYFLEENHFVVDLQSYQYQQPCTEYVQAVTATHVLVFQARAWQELGLTMVDWPRVEHKLFTQALLEKLNRRSALVSPNGTTRYTQFLTTFPGLANRIPLAQLASYLGLTPQSLSRIRRNLGQRPAGPAISEPGSGGN
ncbi:Crp/Fnr family transcriptional regulator [Hymenobacter wooponensis]|uniref:Crp/Fnr family transcriptional regulator n=1 Tax=Hymenobacter wooponensis TaxID=1525360 RepID=A0A4Z0MD57_9BACT|nr:Crp/Fnr family transcriptional regulator [Hymenobacter wooponensis]TGD77673.1 Crp/Fnr family transcriptional regulator [Hymenobacter wooponensis]